MRRLAAALLLSALSACTSEVTPNRTAAPLSVDLRRLRDRFRHTTPRQADPRLSLLPMPPTMYAHPSRPGTFIFQAAHEPVYLHPGGFAWNLGGSWGVHASFEGTSASPVGEAQRPAVVRHLRGRVDPNAPPLPTYGRVTWERAWPGIDVVAEPVGTTFAYSLFVAPGSDLGSAKIRWEGVDGIELRDAGRVLVVRAAGRELVVGGLHAFEIVQGEPVERSVRHRVVGTTTTMEVEGWTGRNPLWVDPTVGHWGTYVGVGKILKGTEIAAIATDSAGNAVVVGGTRANDFPTTPGAPKTSVTINPSHEDYWTYGFVTKVSPKGDLIWSTYLAGSIWDIPNAVAVDKDDQVIVAGATLSYDFPISGGFDWTLDKTDGSYGFDGFVTKLTKAGALAWSTFVGGTAPLTFDEGVVGLAVDDTGRIAVIGAGASPDFPGLTAPPAKYDFVTSITSSGLLQWTRAFANPFASIRSPYSITRHPSGKVTATTENSLIQLDGAGSVLAKTSESTGVLRAFGDEYLKAAAAYDAVGWRATPSGFGSMPCKAASSVSIGPDRDLAFACKPDAGLPSVTPWATCCSDTWFVRRNVDGTYRFSSPVGVSVRAGSVRSAIGAMGETFFAFNPEGPPFTGPMGFDPTGTAYDAFLLRVPGPTALDGAVCAIDLECKSLHCVDGVCCDTACNAACQACSAAKKATGADGACGPAKVDTDPGDRCPTGTSACGADGLCDATGKCRPFAKVGTSCGVSSCTASLQTDKVCKGDGDTCIDATVPCGRYVCGATTCKTTCAIDDDCATDSHCVSGACAAKEPNGVACTADRACVSGHCVDGVCCDSGCEGQCQACDGPTKGTCVPIAGSPHGTRAACDGVGACQGSCDGTDAKVCKLPVGKVCASSCVDGAETLDRCTDLGACKPGTKVSCGAYTCGAAGCRDACTTTADCAAGAVCAAGKCVGPNPDGAACSSGVQCASGHCVDGVCCNTKCDGQCEACDGATKGTCAAVTGTPRGKRPACEGVGVCGATCTGVERTVCLHPSGTLCASTCVDGSETVSRCDGKGVCREGAPKTCSDGCADARCRAACEKDVDCGVDAACIDGVCRSLAPIPGGGCGCSTVGGDQSGAWAGTLLTIVATRRRRRR